MKLLLIIFILGFGACGQHKLVKPVRDLGSEWMPVSLKGAEQAWVVSYEGSSLLVDSDCNKRNQDVSLIGLTGQLLIGMTDQKIIDQKMIPFQNREALVSTYSLKVDGALHKMHILVLRKDGCVFDIVLTTPESTYEKRLPDFEKIQQLFTLDPAKK